MLVGPAAHRGERTYKRFPKSGERVLNRESRLGVCNAPRDQPRRFEVAKRSSQHSLRDVSQTPSQLPVAMRFPTEQGKDLRRPLPDEDRRDWIRGGMRFLLRCWFQRSWSSDNRRIHCNYSLVRRPRMEPLARSNCVLLLNCTAPRKREHQCAYLTSLSSKRDSTTTLSTTRWRG